MFIDDVSTAHVIKDCEKICDAFGIGDPIATAEPAFGGRLHHVSKIKTTMGTYALKILNEKIMQKDNICAAYERSEQVARSFADRGIPAVPALTSEGKCLHQINNNAIMVYKWIEGRALKVGTVDKQCAQMMGEVLGTIHATKLDAGDFRPAKKIVDADQWNNFLKQSKSANYPIAEALKTNAKNLAVWSENANNSIAMLQEDLVLSHGDLDQQNVIWSNNSQPSIIDWESAGLQNPTVEMLNLCLDWSGFPEQVPCKEAFVACYEGYQKSNAAASSLVSFDIALNGEIGYFLSWLSFSLKRFFDCVKTEEKNIALSEASNALRSLRLLDECKSLLLSWI